MPLHPGERRGRTHFWLSTASRGPSGPSRTRRRSGQRRPRPRPRCDAASTRHAPANPLPKGRVAVAAAFQPASARKLLGRPAALQTCVEGPRLPTQRAPRHTVLTGRTLQLEAGRGALGGNSPCLQILSDVQNDEPQLSLHFCHAKGRKLSAWRKWVAPGQSRSRAGRAGGCIVQKVSESLCRGSHAILARNAMNI